MVIATLIKAMAVAALAAVASSTDRGGPGVAPGGTTVERVLYDFGAHPAEADRWRTVMDGVMGGRSSGRIGSTPEGHLLFSGRLSLENNGGFAAMRSPADAAEWDLASADAFMLRVRGDGRTYRFDALLRTGRERAGGPYVSGAEQWRVWQEFATVDGEWIDVVLPFDSFSNPTFYGTEMPLAPALDVGLAARVGVMLYDKRPGPYRLEIASIRVRGVGSAAPGGVTDEAYDARLEGLLARLERSAEGPLKKGRMDERGRERAEAVLVSAVERGVPLFNNRQPAACVAVYETALSSVLTLAPDALSDKELQKVTAILSASWHEPSERAWALRRVIDDLLGLTRS